MFMSIGIAWSFIRFLRNWGISIHCRDMRSQGYCGFAVFDPEVSKFEQELPFFKHLNTGIKMAFDLKVSPDIRLVIPERRTISDLWNLSLLCDCGGYMWKRNETKKLTETPHRLNICLLVRSKARVAMIFVNIYHPAFSLFWKILMFFDYRPLFFTFYRYFVVGIVFYVEQKCIYLWNISTWK